MISKFDQVYNAERQYSERQRQTRYLLPPPADPPAAAPDPSHGEAVVEMQVTRQHVVDILRRAGLQEMADEAVRDLPDPVNFDYAMHWCERHGISHDVLVSLMGGSP